MKIFLPITTDFVLRERPSLFDDLTINVCIKYVHDCTTIFQMMESILLCYNHLDTWSKEFLLCSPFLSQDNYKILSLANY